MLWVGRYRYWTFDAYGISPVSPMIYGRAVSHCCTRSPFGRYSISFHV